MQNYSVKDLYLASFLYAMEQELIEVKRVNGVCWFVFANRQSCEALASQYWACKAVSGIKQYVDAIRTLKDLIYAQR
jgi:hypothetical protein